MPVVLSRVWGGGGEWCNLSALHPAHSRRKGGTGELSCVPLTSATDGKRKEKGSSCCAMHEKGRVDLVLVFEYFVVKAMTCFSTVVLFILHLLHRLIFKGV